MNDIATSLPANAALIVRRALFDRLPGSAFEARNGKDLLRVGPNWVDFNELVDGIVADLSDENS